MSDETVGVVMCKVSCDNVLVVPRRLTVWPNTCLGCAQAISGTNEHVSMYTLAEFRSVSPYSARICRSAWLSK
jgi:hypothetical protein